jgi:hypothetical protein
MNHDRGSTGPDSDALPLGQAGTQAAQTIMIMMAPWLRLASSESDHDHDDDDSESDTLPA